MKEQEWTYVDKCLIVVMGDFKMRIYITASSDGRF